MSTLNAAAIRAGLEKREAQLDLDCKAADDAKWAASDLFEEFNTARQRVLALLRMPDDELIATAYEFAWVAGA